MSCFAKEEKYCLAELVKRALGVDVKSNKVQYFLQSLKNPLHLT